MYVAVAVVVVVAAAAVVVNCAVCGGSSVGVCVLVAEVGMVVVAVVSAIAMMTIIETLTMWRLRRPW